MLGRVFERDRTLEHFEHLAARDHDRFALLVDDRLAGFHPRDRPVFLIVVTRREVRELEQADGGERIHDRGRGSQRLGARRFVAVVDAAEERAQVLGEMFAHVRVLERIGLRLRVVVIHGPAFDARMPNTWRDAGTPPRDARVVPWPVPFITLARPRSALAVLALGSLTIAALPLAAPAAGPAGPSRRPCGPKARREAHGEGAAIDRTTVSRPRTSTSESSG